MTVDPARLNVLVVAVAQARDRAAFQALFDHFAPRVKGYLMRLGAGSAAAEDLAQEAMLAVWRKAVLFDPAKASASTWIFTIARNLRISALRREHRPEPAAEEILLNAPDNAPPADESLAASQRESRLHEALKLLPAEQARVVELSFFEDTPHREIELRLGIPLGTVKSRLRLAIGRLRAIFDGETAS